eukprot:gene21412-biopygen2150
MLRFGGAGALPLMSCRARRTACSASELLGVTREVYAHDVPRSLAAIWLHLTRLETRTKESNMCASLGVTETRRHNESKGCLAAEVRSSFYACEAHHRPTYSTLRKV